MNYLNYFYVKVKNNPFFIKEYFRKLFFYFVGADNKISFYKNLNTLNSNETLNYLIKNNSSFIRFGDGELEILKGGTIYQSKNSWSQVYNKNLQIRLSEIFKFKKKNLLVGINNLFLRMDKKELKKKNFYFYFILYQASLFKYLDKKEIYGDALLFRKDLVNLDFKKLLNYFKKKDLIIVTSNINKFKNIPFSKKIRFVEAPPSNAWDNYDTILKNIFNILNNSTKKNILILISLGPTAKPLILDLTKKNYTSWDMGHFFDFYLDDIKKYYK